MKLLLDTRLKFNFRTVRNLFFLVFGLFVLPFSVSAQQSELIWLTPEKLPSNINSEGEEALLIFSRDSSTLFFVRQFHPENTGGNDDQDIWFTKRNEDGSYQPAKNLKSLNNKDFNAVVGNSLDGNTIYLYNAYVKKKSQLDRGIAISQKKKEGFSSPTKLEITNFKLEGEHFGFYVNPQETVILISYQGKNSLGEEDLYVSLKQSDGSWGEPIHLGNIVNTSGYEISPFLSEDGYSLFFSSNGHGGQGEADIFVCFRMDDTWRSWSKPQNLGDKVNSAGFDAYFIMSANEAYFASNREGGASDIYMVKPFVPEPIEIEQTELKPITAVKDTLPKVKPRPVEFLIFFATNSSFLEKQSIVAIDEAIAKMKADPNLKCDISSHADIRADDAYNTWLTQRRASRVRDYMVLKGIDPSRISSFWHGKKNPNIDCTDCSEEELHMQRRTVITMRN